MENPHLNKWMYGHFWEEHPILEREIWEIGNNRLCVADIIKDKEAIIKNFFIRNEHIDLSYIDPPWNSSNLNAFYTKAGKKETRDEIKNLLIAMIEILIWRHIPINYIEMGKQKLELLTKIIEERGGIVTNIWEVTYYRINPSRLVRFVLDRGKSKCNIDFTGKDDDETPIMAIAGEKCDSVLDLCTGRGLTGRTAHQLGKRFFGVELNKRRLAVLIDYYIKAGLKINKIGRLKI